VKRGPTASKATKLSPEDLDLFARLVHAESAGEPFEGQVAVAASVLNRVKNSRYPDTVREVILQVIGGYYQYSPVLNGRIKLPANQSAYRAIRLALLGLDPSLGATGFYNPKLTDDMWVLRRSVTREIGSHVFFC
jgi:N-acetylmuramoyl-L-alanine amidase